jgi:hypothetical protein
MFLRHCIETFFVRTKPDSSIANPAAIHITRNPPSKNRSVLKTNASFAARLSKVGASCPQAKVGRLIAIAAPPEINLNKRIRIPFIIYN